MPLPANEEEESRMRRKGWCCRFTSSEEEEACRYWQVRRRIHAPEEDAEDERGRVGVADLPDGAVSVTSSSSLVTSSSLYVFISH